MNFKNLTMSALRSKIRHNEFENHTSGLQPDLAQYNIVIMEKKYADDFALFCKKNPIPCPVIHQSLAGEKMLHALGDINITTDLPMYRIFHHGKIDHEVNNIETLWQDDFVTFAIGCSFTFEKAIMDNGVALAHVEQHKNVAMYKTNIPLKPTVHFSGEMVVSMRWIKQHEVDKVTQITAAYPEFHGAPIHVGDEAHIGINDLTNPDYGDYVSRPSTEHVAVFWGCGVTPQNVIMNAKLPLVITHKPGCMLIGDLSNDQVLKQC